MAKKTSTKRAFDWTTYSKPARLLTDTQEAALLGGVLRPLIEAALADDGLRAEIRARQLALYDRGANLMRVSGDGPFSAELDVSFRLPREQRSGEQIERYSVGSPDEVRVVTDALRGLRADFTAGWDASADTGDRTRKQAVAVANSGQDQWADELVVIDLEYTYGKRRYDLLALRRTPGISGPGGFATPRLAFIHVQAPGQTLTGVSGPAAVAADLAEFVKSLSGEHLERARTEMAALVEQKVRLGLLPSLEFRAFDAEMPELLVIFTDDDVSTPEIDRSVIEVHDRLLARHFPIARLRFAHLPGAGEHAAAADLRLGEPDIMDYRRFKEYRRGQVR